MVVLVWITRLYRELRTYASYQYWLCVLVSRNMPEPRLASLVVASFLARGLMLRLGLVLLH
ncbi:hypothetical protein ATG_09440 [Desulfurococcaceae archaeon AG1]|nr:hypothetical protein ATG_09440 [Desulfurococcaceae archaeon AG1]